ncbi:MAG: aspartate carbamoyltransferase, partial [Candidatus Thorarchaeota archaeon]
MIPQHLFSVRNISKDFFHEIFALSSAIEENPIDFADKCKGKILATLFFEPSTRTRLSFESAMLR